MDVEGAHVCSSVSVLWPCEYHRVVFSSFYTFFMDNRTCFIYNILHLKIWNLILSNPISV